MGCFESGYPDEIKGTATEIAETVFSMKATRKEEPSLITTVACAAAATVATAIISNVCSSVGKVESPVEQVAA